MVSIIVPIYQAENFIDKCISSIISQSYTNLEIILVDDGSTDNSLSICKSYADQDNRIILMHTDNCGGAHARNVGLKHAKGDYIAFVDADDYLEQGFIKVLLHYIEKYNADIAECGYYYVEKGEKSAIGVQGAEVLEFDTLHAMKEHVADRMCKQIVWNKLYKRDLIRDIPFVEGKIIDDEFWTYRVIGKSKKIIHICQPLYNYVQHESSVMHKKYNLKRLEALEAQQLRLKYIQNNYTELKDYAEYMLYFACMYHMQMCLKYLDSNSCNKAFQIISQIISQEYKKFTFVKTISPIQKFWVMAARINFKLTCKIRNLLKIGI